TTGTVSVVDLTAGETVKTIEVGLHPTAMLLRGHLLFVANTNSDTVSVIDTRKDKVVSTIAITPFARAPYGSAPTGLALLPGHRLAVTLGRSNAVAFFHWQGRNTPTAFEGLVPTGWYPSDIKLDAGNGQLLVVNSKGVGSLGYALAGTPVADQVPKQVQT